MNKGNLALMSLALLAAQSGMTFSDDKLEEKLYEPPRTKTKPRVDLERIKAAEDKRARRAARNSKD